MLIDIGVNEGMDEKDKGLDEKDMGLQLIHMDFGVEEEEHHKENENLDLLYPVLIVNYEQIEHPLGESIQLHEL